MTSPARSFLACCRASVASWSREVARSYGGPDPVLVAERRDLRRQVSALRRETARAAERHMAVAADRDRLRVALPDAQVLAERTEAAEAQRDQAVLDLDAAQRRARRAERGHAKVAARLEVFVNTEPPAVDGCVKLRARDETEAWRFAEKLAAETGREPDEFDVYPCPTCPRQVLGGVRFWHVTNRDPHERTGRDGVSRREGHRRTGGRARAEGRQLEQRVGGEVAARLRSVAGGEG